MRKLLTGAIPLIIFFAWADAHAEALGPQPAEATCPAGNNTLPTFAAAMAAPHWTGWGANGAQTRFQPEAMARLSRRDVSRLTLKWAFGFEGAHRAVAQPSVLGGRLFVGSQNGKVYSIDAKSGCEHWQFDASAAVHTAISIGPAPQGWSLYFGDRRANAYAVDALSGKLLWKVHLDDDRAATITGAPLLADGVLYVPVSSFEEALAANPHYACCTFRGSLLALDAATGRQIWKSYTIPSAPQPVRKSDLGVQLWGPSGAAVWSSPTIDRRRNMIYVTTGDSYSDPAAQTSDAIVAFEMGTGRLAWWRQMTAGDAYNVACGRNAPGVGNCPQAAGPDFDFGSSPILVELANGRRLLIAGQKSGMVYAVDPDKEGEIVWQRRVGQGGKIGGVQWGPAADQQHVYIAVSDARFRLASAGTSGAQPLWSSFTGIYLLLDPNAGGGLYGLKLESGDVAWHTPDPGCAGQPPGCSPAQPAAVTAIPGVVFSADLYGRLLAYDASDGKIIWDADTKGTRPTANAVAAYGGSVDGQGAVVVDGMVYIGSGSEFVGTIPGNVLLAFGTEP